MPESNENYEVIEGVDAPNALETPSEGEPELPAALAAVDPEKLRALRERIEATISSKEKTPSGSEAVSDSPIGTSAPAVDQRLITGRDVDWSEYNLDFNVAHLYPRSVLIETPQGPKWAVRLTEFYSSERSAGSHGKKSSSGESLNLGEYMTEMVNSADSWKIAGLLPGSTGRGIVIFEREVPYILPDPEPLKTTTEVEPPLDPELDSAEQAAIAWAEKEGHAVLPFAINAGDEAEQALNGPDFDNTTDAARE